MRDNQRLELLGDAALGLVSCDWLMRQFPEATEGAMSKARATLINQLSLAEAAKRLSVDDLLRVGRGEMKLGPAARRARLADAFEAILGALYLDLGLEACARLFERALSPNLESLAQLAHDELGHLDPKSLLIERCRRSGEGRAPSFTPLSPREPPLFGPFGEELVGVTLECVPFPAVEGWGINRREAEKAASAEALSLWRLSSS